MRAATATLTAIAGALLVGAFVFVFWRPESPPHDLPRGARGATVPKSTELAPSQDHVPVRESTGDAVPTAAVSPGLVLQVYDHLGAAVQTRIGVAEMLGSPVVWIGRTSVEGQLPLEAVSQRVSTGPFLVAEASPSCQMWCWLEDLRATPALTRVTLPSPADVSIEVVGAEATAVPRLWVGRNADAPTPIIGRMAWTPVEYPTVLDVPNLAVRARLPSTPHACAIPSLAGYVCSPARYDAPFPSLLRFTVVPDTRPSIVVVVRIEEAPSRLSAVAAAVSVCAGEDSRQALIPAGSG